MNRFAIAARLEALLADPGLPDDARRTLSGCAAELRAERYVRPERIFQGGMGEVTAVFDEWMGREVAIKALREDRWAGRATETADGRKPPPEFEQFFRQEMILTPQLQHPAIVPVHDAGELADGRPYFTMKRVRGDGSDARSPTLADVIREVHASVRDAQWLPSPGGWTLHRLLAALVRVCEAVAYAHTRGVLHLDLKPMNVLVGAFGEIGLIDWGIARVVEATPGADPVHVPNPVQPRRGFGTPAYMSPEQAVGEEAPTRASDVYSLGAILYEILAGRPPFEGTPSQIIQSLKRGVEPVDPGRVVRDELPGTTYGYDFEAEADLSPLVPRDLYDICRRAMSRDPKARYATAEELRADVEAWLDGSKRRVEALARVEQAREMSGRLAELRGEVDELHRRARELAAHLAPWDKVAEKQPLWDLERRADAAEQELTAATLRFVQRLHAAIIHVPNLVEAHEMLADHYQDEHRRALAQRDPHGAAVAEALLRAHDTGRHARWLKGLGTVSLTLSVPDADLRVRRWAEGADRRLHLEAPIASAVGGLRDLALPEGSYLVEIRHRSTLVRYPVLVQRDEAWNTVPPEDGDPRAVHLPGPGDVGNGEVYVPAGWFVTGGPPTVPGAGAWRRVWVEGFVIQADPVTNDDYLAFLDDLLARGRRDEAMEHVPRTNASRVGASGEPMYGCNEQGFFLQTDAEGDTWHRRWPVLHVSWEDARAYARWLSERTGLPWRLPLELEWEKAARGVDGRMFPWGEHFDANWARTRDSSRSPQPTVVEDTGDDTSPYGVRGMAGNARDWCLDWWRPDGPAIVGSRPALPAAEDPAGRRVLRGGAWNSGVNYAQVASRDGDHPASRKSHFSFRLVRPLG